MITMHCIQLLWASCAPKSSVFKAAWCHQLQKTEAQPPVGGKWEILCLQRPPVTGSFSCCTQCLYLWLSGTAEAGVWLGGWRSLPLQLGWMGQHEWSFSRPCWLHQLCYRPQWRHCVHWVQWRQDQVSGHSQLIIITTMGVVVAVRMLALKKSF